MRAKALSPGNLIKYDLLSKTLSYETLAEIRKGLEAVFLDITFSPSHTFSIVCDGL